jgi:DNA-binding NtrC family response regulator
MVEKETIAEQIVGEAYTEVKKLVKQYASEDLPVLLVGETGTGKELLARLYMEENVRKGKKLTGSCAEITETLLRSEIFGHVKGSFTDAIANREGKLATCDKGILFLDELGKASKGFQAAILRVTEQNSFSPVGSDVEKTSDVIIIAATSNLPNIEEDLKNRFDCLLIPPLWVYDIPLIAEKILGKPLKESIIKELMSKKYPGNVRDLLRVCKRLKMERGEEIFSASPYRREHHHFDYGRFRFEYELWLEYIQPILDEYHVKELKYDIGRRMGRNHDRPIKTRDTVVTMSHAPWSSTNREGLERHDIVDSILRLRDGGECDVARLVEGLREYIERGWLSYFLDYLNKRVNKLPGFERVEVPDITHLFEPSLEEARKHFEVIYLKHQIKTCEGDIGKAAEKLDMTEKNLRQKLYRARKKTRNLESQF